MKDLNEMGVRELNEVELKELEGGKSYWDHCVAAFGTLTNDFIGLLAVGVFPGPCLLAVAIGGGINYYNEHY
jgi:hypothetical protein